MELNKLRKTTSKSNKRVGRGIGSGKGKTAGRGYKGAKARSKTPLGFIGGTLPLYKKLPFRRGWGNRKVSIKMKPIDLSKLSNLEKDTVVDLSKLISLKLITENQAKKFGAKIVGNKGLDKPLTIQVPTSSSAAKAIEKAGGKVLNA